MSNKIPKLLVIVGSFLFVGLLVACVPQSPPEPQNQIVNNRNLPTKGITLTSELGEVNFRVELATTNEQRQEGLMFREEMPVDRGMLFVFDDSSEKTFWMKNTYIPLDMLFLTDDYRVMHIEKQAQPCVDQSQCPFYSSHGAAKYVLEINAGLADTYGINAGSILGFKD